MPFAFLAVQSAYVASGMGAPPAGGLPWQLPQTPSISAWMSQGSPLEPPPPAAVAPLELPGALDPLDPPGPYGAVVPSYGSPVPQAAAVAARIEAPRALGANVRHARGWKTLAFMPS
jgi:hypothetical protein